MGHFRSIGELWRLSDWGFKRWGTAGIAAVILSGMYPVSAADSESNTTTKPQVEMFIMVGPHPIWAGSNFGYTVYQPSQVEMRVSTMTGELIIIMPIGLKQPGRYMLPWDGTYQGIAALAGRYEFELFFDHEYAAHFWFLSRPVPSN